MKDDKSRLISLFERKINILLDENECYARFKGNNLLKVIKRILSKELLKEDIMDLGFLIHLYTLNFRLTVYKNLTPFSIINFKKDLQEIINVLHAYSKHKNPQAKLPPELTETPEIEKLIPPLLDWNRQDGLSSDNPELYNEILNMLEVGFKKGDVEIPKDIIKEMQRIDLKKIYNELPKLIEKKKNSTIRNLASDFPVFENDKLSLVAVFNEVLFLANEGKVQLQQIDDDVGVGVLI